MTDSTRRRSLERDIPHLRRRRLTDKSCDPWSSVEPFSGAYPFESPRKGDQLTITHTCLPANGGLGLGVRRRTMKVVMFPTNAIVNWQYNVFELHSSPPPKEITSNSDVTELTTIFNQSLDTMEALTNAVSDGYLPILDANPVQNGARPLTKRGRGTGGHIRSSLGLGMPCCMSIPNITPQNMTDNGAAFVRFLANGSATGRESGYAPYPYYGYKPVPWPPATTQNMAKIWSSKERPVIV
ncbi:hypothetical protein EDD85DRAFT_792088 [Armillaria nabsnona]|nr:hypothetical protein EDD85DRAFT_792088 [Armillaria nabsnona]